MKRKERSNTPPAPAWGWKVVVGGFVLMGTVGVALSLLFRDSTSPEQLSARERRQGAKQATFAVVYSTVDQKSQQTIVDGIVADIGADSSITDLVIGSNATDPWCTSLQDYKNSMHVAMTSSRKLELGKQSLILSMVGGILTKEHLPATIYLIGNLSDSLSEGVAKRTLQTISAFEIRHEVHAPLSIVSYMDTSASRANAQYVKLFENRAFSFEQR